MKEPIRSEEILYRAVKPKPVFWKEGGRVTSALFKDSKGVSVDRDGGRSTEEVISNFITKMGEENVVATAFLSAQECFDIDAVVLPKPIDGNEYHAEIHHSETQIELTKKQAKALADCCKLVFVKESSSV